MSRLMALAILYDGLLRDGTARDQTELAGLSHVIQPEMLQIMNLLHLAPNLQEEILFLPRAVPGGVSIHEKMLRPIAAVADWGCAAKDVDWSSGLMAQIKRNRHLRSQAGKLREVNPKPAIKRGVR